MPMNKRTMCSFPLRVLTILFGVAGSMIPAMALSGSSSPVTADPCCNSGLSGEALLEPELVRWLDRIANNAPVLDRCEVVEIEGQRQSGKDSLSSIGQGSVFKSANEPKHLFVLTAAHVVAGAEKVQVRCGGKVVQAKVRGISQTKDLAVLELEKIVSDLTPLFVWDGFKLPVAEVRHLLPINRENWLPEGSHYIQTAADFVNRENLHLARVTEDGLKVIPNRFPVQIELATQAAEHPLIGSRSAVLLPKQGVRPGMSGSPIIYTVLVPRSGTSEIFESKTFLSGILLKTFLNETQSVAVPIETINEALPGLMNGLDVSKAEGSPYYYDRTVTQTPGGAVGTPEITFRVGATTERFQSVCPSPFVDSSSGLRFSGDVGKGGGGDVGKGGGGDVGKGGGGDVGGIAKEGYYNSPYFSLYRSHVGCKETGIKDSLGNVYLAIRKEGGGVIRAESIEDISGVIQTAGMRFPDLIKSRGLKSRDAKEIYRLYCSDPDLFDKKGHPKKVRIERRDFDPKKPEIAHYASAGEVPNGQKFADVKLKVNCDAAAGVVKVQVSRRDFSADLTIKPDSWSGTIQFRNCKSSFSRTPKSLWLASHRDAKLDVQMSLSPDRSFLSFNIFSADPSCLAPSARTGAPSDVWLSKVELTLPAEPEFRTRRVPSDDELRREKELIQSDTALAKSAEAALASDRSKAEQAVRTLKARELAELEKGRIGEPVSKDRISILDLLIARLEGFLRR